MRSESAAIMIRQGLMSSDVPVEPECQCTSPASDSEFVSLWYHLSMVGRPVPGLRHRGWAPSESPLGMPLCSPAWRPTPLDASESFKFDGPA